MKRTILVLILMSLGTAAHARADDPEALLTQGKLDVDMGDGAAAAAAFEGVMADPAASSPLRGEALVRLGLVRKSAGNEKGASEAFALAWSDHRQEKDVVALLLQALGQALPGDERWDAIWNQVVVKIPGTRDGEQPITVEWPGVEVPHARPRGDLIDLHFKDGDLQDIFRLFADISRLNVVVHPGVQGTVTLRFHKMPWPDALDRILAPNGYAASRVDNVLEIAEPRYLPSARRFEGAPVDLDFHEVELVDALRQVAAHGKRTVAADPAVAGHMTLKLSQVHWDQAFDMIVRLNGLKWQQAGTTLNVGPR
jgi:type II secretory pathway component GspD/PulD (secretin)